MKFTNLFLHAAALVSVVRASAIPADAVAHDAPTPTLTGTYDNGIIHWVLTAQVASATKMVISENGPTQSFTWQTTGGSISIDGVALDSSKYTIHSGFANDATATGLSGQELTYNLPDAVVSDGDNGPWTEAFIITYYYADGTSQSSDKCSFTVEEPIYPKLTGTYDNGVIHWMLTAPVDSSAKIICSQTGDLSSFTWQYTGASFYIDDSFFSNSLYKIEFDNGYNTITVDNLDFSDANGQLTYNMPDAVVSEDDAGPWTLEFYVDYYYEDGQSHKSEPASYTVHKPAVSKSSQSASKSSASQSSSSSAASPSTPSVSSSTSTTSTISSISSNSEGSTTGNNVATTVITITSCADHICTKKPVTTGVTVCTATENGVETIYTTYCPLSGVTQETATPETLAPVTTPAATTPATAPAATLASVSQSQTYTPPAVATATGIAAAVEVKGAAFGAALIALVALM